MSKRYLFTLIILVSSTSMFSQSVDVFSKYYYLNFNFTKNNSDISEYYDNAKIFSLLKYNIGCSYIDKKQCEYSLSFGYYKSKANRKKLSITTFDTLIYEKWEQNISLDYNAYNLNFSFGKRINLKNFILSTTIAIPFEISSNWINTYHSYTQDTILKTNEEYYESTKAPIAYSTGLFFNISIYSKIFNRLYFGFDCGTGIAINISKGKYYLYSKNSDITNNTEIIRDQIYKQTNVSYYLPITSSIGVRYLLHNNPSTK